ncbi:hypothetical protein HDV04_003529 [Boothiomyces sp. JEL0838]|nr:hypothetical protein HDV04_003529 [Boothiomyces sp. JEL0838]
MTTDIEPPSYFPAKYVPVQEIKSKKIQFVQVSAISFIKLDKFSWCKIPTVNFCNAIAYWSRVKVGILSELTLEEYVFKYLPHFILIDDYAINPTNILKIYPSGRTGCTIDLLQEHLNENMGNTTSLQFNVTCATLLERIDKRSKDVAAMELANVDIGYGQKINQ